MIHGHGMQIYVMEERYIGRIGVYLNIIVLFILSISISHAKIDKKMFIDSKKASQIAKKEIQSVLKEKDPMFVLWKNDSLGQAILVRDVLKKPSYWLVPVVVHKRSVGFIRIMGSGSVDAIGTSCRDAEDIQSCPTVVTGITKQAALHLVQKECQLKKVETLSEPIFIYDGSIGREAWLVEILQNKKVIRWIFVTIGGVYERPAGESLKGVLE